MSLLDDVSIVVTPNGYKAGELYAVVPVPTEGAEEVVNGDFATDSDWDLGSSWDISGGKANYDAVSTGQELRQLMSSIDVGQLVNIVFEVSDIENGKDAYFKLDCSGAPESVFTYTKFSAGTYTYAHAVTSGFNRLTFTALNSSTGGYFSIDNVSVKEYTTADMDVTRATDATRVNESGLIEDVLSNVPRIDYTGGGCPHILAEPQRTNNIQYSEDFTQSYWRKDKVTVTANSIISPSGQLDASLIQETVYTGGIPSFDLLSSITLGTGSHTFTFYVKNNNGRYLGISFGSNTQRVRTNFDFTTNTFKTLIFNGTTTGSASFKTLGDYYRISITATFPSSTVADTVLMPLATDTYPFYAFQDSDNRSFYLWGAQVEVGSYPTSYIPTSGSTVTRNQDIFTRDGIGSLINSTEGCVFGEGNFAESNLGGGYNYFVSLSDGTVNNRLEIRQTSSNVQFLWRVATYQSQIPTSGVDVGNNFKFAVSYSSANIKFYVNGNLIGTINTPTLWSANTLNRLAFDDGAGGNRLSGKVKQLQVYKTALTDAQLTSLTS